MYKFFLLIFTVVTLIFTLFFDIYHVSGSSMAPLYSDGDVVIVKKRTVFNNEVEEGDIILFRSPLNGRVNIKECRYIDGDRIFVTGIDLCNSTDSRHFGRISTDDVMGFVWIKI